MKLSVPWLRELVEIPAADRALAEELTHTGTAVESVVEAHGGTRFEMEITTNRVDCMNHYGVARECSAIYDRPLQPLVASLPAARDGAKFPIEIEDPAGCARFSARMLRNVKIGPASPRVAQRLELAGLASISNAVDASNYTLIEMGHPTHAYDLDLLTGGKIIVRRARAGERLKTLDGVERKLDPDDLIIADAQKPIGLAGVMGGFDTMITATTRNILLEAAWFAPAAIRRSARRHGLHTDASHRFERGADFSATTLACARVAELILHSAGGELAGPESDCIARPLERLPLLLRRAEIRRILGQEISEEQITRILTRLGFALQPRAAAAWQVALPTWRLDVEREIDLIEEVARLYGYNNFRNTLPAFSGAVAERPQARKHARVRERLLALGYDEAISSSFASAAEAQEFAPLAQPVALANPLSEEAALMRTSLVPGMLAMLAHNLHRGTVNVRLFESGNVFSMNGGKTEERWELCLGATGNAVAADAQQPARPYSFFDLKGAAEALLPLFECRSLEFHADAQAAHYHPGRSARVALDGKIVARFGQLSPEVAAARKLKQEIYVAEISLDQLYAHSLRQARYQALSRYPAVERDFSFVFGDGATFEHIRAAAVALRITELAGFEPVDMLRGKEAEPAGIRAGSYSLLLRATFQAADRTLRDEEITAWSQQIIAALTVLGGKLRG